jgi:hypothetical protein
MCSSTLVLTARWYATADAADGPHRTLVGVTG